MGGTTAWEVHCSGSWPTWMACVAKCWKLGRKPGGEAFFFCMLSCKERRAGKSEVDETRKLVCRGLKETQESDKSELGARGATYGEYTKPDSAAE